ncbi:MAG: ABC transporter permease subunit [Chloroflexi bacterium]|nr:ABC transporter permease subunit [Chloroflexota bacterium]
MALTYVLLKKELLEHLKTYRLLIVVGVLLVFGLASPLLLAYLPDLLRLSGEDISIPLPQFAAVDALKSYLDSLGQVGLLTAILVSMGAIAQERERGTAALVLSKPVGIAPFVLAKFLGLAAILTLGLAAGAAGCYVYTLVLFGPASLVPFALASLLAWLYLMVVLAITILLSATFRSQVAAGVLALALVISFATFSAFSLFEPFLPASLMHWANALVLGQDESRWTAVAVSVALLSIVLVGAWQSLQRREV